MQYIIDAPPRTGKSQYALYLIDKFTKQHPNRHIVTNIIGINYPGVISVNGSLHSPVDWRDFPNGTIFIYDEAHEHPAFSKDDLMKDLQVDTRDLDAIVSKISNSIFSEDVLYYIDNYFKFNDYDQEQIAEIKAKISLEKKLPLDFKKLIFDDINKKKKMALVKKKEDILDIGRSLTLHGHFGFDIYLITQDITRLNAATIAATSRQLKLRRLFGWPMMLIYEYAEVQKYFTGTTRNNALGIKLFFYKPYLYKYYISSEEHNVPKSYPTMIIALLLMVVALFGWGFTKLKASNALGLFGDSEQMEVSSPAPQSDKKNQQNVNPDVQKKVALCQEQLSWTEQQCLEAYDPEVREQRHKELQQSTRNDMETVVLDYNPNNPFQDLSNQVSYQPTTNPVFSGCMKKNGRYVAYTQQGTILRGVTEEDCRRVVEDGDRPFNYFQQPQQQQVHQEQTPQQHPAYQKAYYENLARLDAERLHSQASTERVSTSDSGNQNYETSSL